MEKKDVLNPKHRKAPKNYYQEINQQILLRALLLLWKHAYIQNFNVR